MKKSNRKGFTIVELVIVIAVIAILAAVLIPTFTNLVKKANQSADMQAARQMSTVLSAEPGIGNDIDKVIDLLVEAGYNAAESLKPITKDHAFYYFVDGEFIALVDTAKGEVVFPKDTTIPEDSALYFDLGNCGKYIDVAASTVEDLKAALALGSEYIKLEDNIAVTTGLTITSDVTIDLNGKELDASAQGDRPFNVTNGATLTINADGATIKCGKYGLVNVPAGNSATVVINGANITANLENGAFIKVRTAGEGSTVNVTLNNVTYTDVSDDSFIVNADGFAGTMTLSVIGGNYKAPSGFQVVGSTSSATFENATIETSNYAFEISKSKATIKNCVITTTNNGAMAAGVAVSYGGEATVTGCTITSADYALAVFNTGGKIEYSNCTITGKTEVLTLNDGATGSITEQ